MRLRLCTLFVTLALLAPACNSSHLAPTGHAGGDSAAETTCSNQRRDGDESDIDCGGSCSPCATGRACAEGRDCQSTYCGPSNACVDPCTNGTANPPACDACADPAHDPGAECTACVAPFDGFPDCDTCANPQLDATTTCTECLNQTANPPTCDTCAVATRDPSTNCTTCADPWGGYPACDQCAEATLDPASSCTACVNHAGNPPACDACVDPRHDPTNACASCLAPFSGWPDCANCVSPDMDPANHCWTEQEKIDHMLAILNVADHSLYECETPVGSVYFRYGYGCESLAHDHLYFHPVYDASSPDGSCSDWTHLEVSGRQRCVFYDDASGRWSLYLGTPLSLDGLPATVTDDIAVSYDCNNSALLSGVDPAMCEAVYTCTLFDPNPTWADLDEDGDGTNNADDCAPQDRARWQYLVGYPDADGDGYPVDEMHFLCSGAAVPAGYIADPSVLDNCPTLCNPDQADVDSDGWGDICDMNDLDLSDSTVLDAHFAAILAAAQSTTYECVTPRGNVYFKYAYGAASSTEDYLYFYPVSDGTDGSCTNPVVTTVGGTQRCIFYDSSSGRWSLDLGQPTQMRFLPTCTTQAIATSWDCDYFALQSGVTPEMCSAQYTCTIYP